MRNKLTDFEWNAIQDYTSASHLDEVFDVCYINENTDGFEDFEEEKVVDLQTGLQWLYSGMAYSPLEEGLTQEQAQALADLLAEFRIVEKNSSAYEWVAGEE